MDKVAPIKRIAQGIVRVLGLNPGPFTLDGTNTYVFGNGERRLLVDTGDGEQPEYFDLLKQCLGGSRIDRILLTHWHGDHIGGVNRLLAMPEVVTPDCAVFKHPDPVDARDDVRAMLAQAVLQNRLRGITDSQLFAVDDIQLQAVFTPGHTDDHMAFIVTSDSFAKERLLLTGDLVLGRGTTIVSDLQRYMESLKTMLDTRPSALLPGHGPIISGSDGETPNAVRVIEGYIEHRNLRERQIIAVLSGEPPEAPPMPRNGGWRLEEVAAAVYPEITDPKVILAAQHNARLHLDKLVSDDKAEKRLGTEPAVELWALRDRQI